MKSCWWVLIWVLSMQGAQAASPADFSYGFRLELGGDSAIYSVELSEAVYKGLVRPDRGDLRIFNSQGTAVPHFIKQPSQPVKQQMPDIRMPLFPLYAEYDESGMAGAYHVQITTSATGAIIGIDPGKHARRKNEPIGYLIDASQLEHEIGALILDWPKGQENFIVSLTVQSSSDLNTWHTLVSRATVSHLLYGEHTLIKQRIDLPSAKYKYLRLTWPGRPLFVLDQVKAKYTDRYRATARRWTEFSMTSIDKAHRYFIFDTKGVLPVDRLDIRLSQRNTLARILVESSHLAKGPWSRQCAGLIYNLQFDGTELKSKAIELSLTTDRYWRVQLLNAEGQLGDQPKLHLGWIPERVLFVAQGGAPFVLAFGSARVEAVHTPLNQLLGLEQINQNQVITAARLGSRIALGDLSNLIPKKPPADWKRIVLWGVLLIGVAILSWMALRLYREMDRAQ